MVLVTVTVTESLLVVARVVDSVVVLVLDKLGGAVAVLVWVFVSEDTEVNDSVAMKLEEEDVLELLD